MLVGLRGWEWARQCQGLLAVASRIRDGANGQGTNKKQSIHKQ